LRRHDLDEFVSLYNPENRHERTTTWSEENPGGPLAPLLLRGDHAPRERQPRPLLD
jgi:hypothetical protein